PQFYTTATTFESYITSQLDSSPTYISQFKAQYACPGYTGTGRRYHISLLCGLLVDFASTQQGARACKSAGTAYVPLCKGTAAAAVASLQALFGNAAVCPAAVGGAGATVRTVGQSTEIFASRLKSDTNCVPATAEEWGMCGFYSDPEAAAYCANPTTATDACCAAHAAKLAGQPIVVPTSLGPATASAPAAVPSLASTPPGVASTTPGVTPTNTASTANTAAKNTTNDPALGPGAIAGIVAGVAALLILAVILRILYTSRKQRRAASGRKDVGEPIQIAQTMEVVYNYVPNLVDEIYLYIGDPVIVKCKFDDGWGYGFNMTTKQEGSFPLACVAP
ncbi:uncharacterized protein EV422DRAFT_489051, partial [Fimicolochytrium jonesii]|uniref:uncharacterized protein n=1 Tax=Fimicolochytrium jonesii TaxID=1396493 RepID=UPI0022FDC048